MEPTRRRFVAGAAALATAPFLPACEAEPAGDSGVAAAGPTPERPPEPGRWDAPGELDTAAFPFGVQAGDATPTGVLLSLRADEPELVLVVVVADGEGWAEVHRSSHAPVDGHVATELVDLVPDSAYRYAWLTPDESRRTEVGRFRTALADGGWRRIRFGATSCLGGSNPAWTALEHAAREDLDFFLLLGDTVYADGSVTKSQYRAEYDAVFAKESFNALSASTSFVATWDDHEVDNNWAAGDGPGQIDAEHFANALAAFREALPMREGPGGSGLWRTLRWGDALELIVLDSRGERDGATQIVSDEQLAWAVDAVTTSTAAFKVVLCSVHLADHAMLFGVIEADDRWQGYPAQRQQLVDALVATPGTIVVTGDMHYSAIQRLDGPEGPGFSVFEVAAGPSGSSINPLPGYAVSEQYPLALLTWSCCVFDVDPGEGTMLVQFLGDDGDVLAEQLLDLAAGEFVEV